MKRLLIFLLTLLSPVSADAAPLRGVWVSTAANLDYPTSPASNADELRSQADTIINTCADLGMNTIFLQVRPSCDAIYPSRLYPYSAYLTGTQGVPLSDGSDILAYWVERAHSSGMELHAWINPYRVSTIAAPSLSADNPAVRHPDWVVRCDGKLYLDPGLPEVRAYVVDGVRELTEGYDIDGIHFDDYFYPSKDFDDSASYAAYGSGADISDWRRSNTEALIRETGEAVRSAGLRFGVSPNGIWANKSSMENGSDTSGSSAYFDMYADTLKWSKEHLVDYIAPQIYWYNGFEAADYAVLCTWWSDQLYDSETDLYIGLGDYRLTPETDASSPWYDGNELLRQMRMNAENDTIKGEIHFRYGSIVHNPPLYEKIRHQYASESDTEPQNTEGAEQKKATRFCEWLFKILNYFVRVSTIRSLISLLPSSLANR